MELPGADQAKTVAHDIASQIAQDVVSENRRNVVVVDDDGAEIYKTPINGDGAS